MEIDSFILDIDGTLLDSHDAHLRAWKKALFEYGVVKSDAEIVKHFGKPTPVIAQLLVAIDDYQVILDVAEQKTNYFIEEIERIPLYPGVDEILHKLYENGKKICFASSNYNRVLAKMYQVYSWDEISLGYVGIDDVQQPKPHPEMIKFALNKINGDASKAVMIGDSKYDIQAGQAAGTKTIAICTKHPFNWWKSYSPDIILNIFQDLFPLLPLRF